MRSIYKLGLLMILTFLVLNGRICNAGKVSAEDCTKVGTECSGITHAVCNKTSLKCQCDAGFKEDSTGGSTCIKKKVSEVVCTNGGSECSTITHSSCAATLKCKCGTGYGEDTTDGSTCVSSASSHNIQSKRRVSEVVCTDGGNECDTIVHSACDVPSLKCKCGTTYAEDSTDGSTCVMKVASIVCSENGSQCASIDHAECDLTATKCKCSDGFKMTADKCAPAGNTGVSASLAYTVLALPVILAIKVTMM
ncbi:major surface-labeled trophozoite antigen 417-like isoform X2 [Ruditapes philippinarum]|uniref:major surface-labeled trophozoite antigen 417-like isoform X2 n=1 Tax=Ruditapes philippinarum TaxID=129788 RepID=UPI00295B09B9|nr:major surface-labeled trophozoite antigen 417-like isoform X2 [Ruditapes philippinarum]